jgi:hypothetical protein
MRLSVVSLSLLLAALVSSTTAAQEVCPPCECSCLDPTADPARLITGSMSITVGDGNIDVWRIVEGPVVLTALTIDCAADIVLVSSGGEAIVQVPIGRLFVPAGGRLEARTSIGFCRGTVAFSGFRP